MYYDKTGTAAKARTTTLNEELGMPTDDSVTKYKHRHFQRFLSDFVIYFRSDPIYIFRQNWHFNAEHYDVQQMFDSRRVLRRCDR